MKWFLAVLGAFVIAASISFYALSACKEDWCLIFEWQKARATNNFEDCVRRKFLVLDLHPRRCIAGGRIFVEKVHSPSGVKGTVTIGPICPVLQKGEEDECGDKPYAALLKVTSLEGNEIAQTTSSPQGVFSITLPAGDYVIIPLSASLLPHAPSQQVHVEEGLYVNIHISYDTGIR